MSGRVAHLAVVLDRQSNDVGTRRLGPERQVALVRFIFLLTENVRLQGWLARLPESFVDHGSDKDQDGEGSHGAAIRTGHRLRVEPAPARSPGATQKRPGKLRLAPRRPFRTVQAPTVARDQNPLGNQANWQIGASVGRTQSRGSVRAGKCLADAPLTRLVSGRSVRWMSSDWNQLLRFVCCFWSPPEKKTRNFGQKFESFGCEYNASEAHRTRGRHPARISDKRGELVRGGLEGVPAHVTCLERPLAALLVRFIELC